MRIPRRKPPIAATSAIILAIVLHAARLSAQGTIAPSPFQVVFNNSGQIVNGACIWVYQAGTVTAVNTYTDVALASANTNPIRSDAAGRFTAFLTPGSAYKFVYETSCTPPGHGSVLRTADNIVATPANAAGVDVLGTAGEALTAGQAVYLSDGSGSKTAGQWFKGDPANTYSSTLPTVGLATAAIASAGTGTIRLSGTVTGLSSLTVGAQYFVSTAGAITTSAPANRRLLGVADSTSTLVLSANPPSTDATTLVPTGAILFFNTTSCPTGWGEFTSARGRYVVGLLPAGTLNTGVGTALTNQEDRTHTHSIPALAQNRSATANFDFGVVSDHTFAFQQAGGGFNFTAGGGGGTGPSVHAATTDATTGTGTTGTQSVTPAPYIQLLVCQKS